MLLKNNPKNPKNILLIFFNMNDNLKTKENKLYFFNNSLIITKSYLICVEIKFINDENLIFKFRHLAVNYFCQFMLKLFRNHELKTQTLVFSILLNNSTKKFC